MSLTLYPVSGLKPGHFLAMGSCRYYLVEFNEKEQVYCVIGSFSEEFDIEESIPKDYIKYVIRFLRDDMNTRFLLEAGFNVEVVTGFRFTLLKTEDPVPVKFGSLKPESKEISDRELSKIGMVPVREPFETVHVKGLPNGYSMPKNTNLNWIIDEKGEAIGKLTCDRLMITSDRSFQDNTIVMNANDIAAVSAIGLRYDNTGLATLVFSAMPMRRISPSTWFQYKDWAKEKRASEKVLVEGLPDNYVMPMDEKLNWIINNDNSVIGSLCCSRSFLKKMHSQSKWYDRVSPLRDSEMASVKAHGLTYRPDLLIALTNSSNEEPSSLGPLPDPNVLPWENPKTLPWENSAHHITGPPSLPTSYFESKAMTGLPKLPELKEESPPEIGRLRKSKSKMGSIHGSRTEGLPEGYAMSPDMRINWVFTTGDEISVIGKLDCHRSLLKSKDSDWIGMLVPLLSSEIASIKEIGIPYKPEIACSLKNIRQ